MDLSVDDRSKVGFQCKICRQKDVTLRKRMDAILSALKSRLTDNFSDYSFPVVLLLYLCILVCINFQLIHSVFVTVHIFA